MDKFLKRHKLPKPIQKETDNLNDPVLIKLEFNLQLKMFPSERRNKQTKNSLQAQMASLMNFKTNLRKN